MMNWLKSLNVRVAAAQIFGPSHSVVAWLGRLNPNGWRRKCPNVESPEHTASILPLAFAQA